MSEILYKLDAQASPADPRDYQAESIFPADLSLPKVWDPRNKMLPVRNQGVQGSCVAESTACVKELQELKNVGFEEYMSPQFVYNHRYNQEGEGMYPRDSVAIVYKKGIVPEAEYPYGKREKPEQISTDVLRKALNYKAKGYAFVNTIDVCKSAIYRSGAVVFTVPVYDNNSTMWKPSRVGAVVQGGHAMTAVGWNETGFIVRNSWGEQWGDKGYTIFPYSDWGMHGEVWTLIDDESSKPDPKYSKWYWKTWRAIVNTAINMRSLVVTAGVVFAASIYIGITDNQWAFIATASLPILLAIFSWYKKLYLVKEQGDK